MADPIAYLSGEYPKVSHTFIQREIAALRARGLPVLTCTIRRAPAKTVVGPDQIEEQRQTFCVIDAARSPLTLVRSHARILRHNPAGWLAAARLAWRTRPAGLKAGLWQVFYFLEAGVLASYLMSKGVRHLHNHFANSSCTVAMLGACMSRIPFSFTLHGPAIFFEPRHWRIDEKIARADFVACISHFCRAQAMLFSDQTHWDKLKIVHCGVLPDKYGTSPRDTFGKRIMFVGRLDAIKGVPLLLEAFAALRAAHPDARLSIVGDGPHRGQLENQARLLGIADQTSFLGYRHQDEVAGLLEQADMLVLPSFAEGVPVVLMEAMASRIPVIASQVAGVGELVEDGVSGFVIPAGDVATLIARIATLLDNPDMARAFGQAGRQKVVTSFHQTTEAGKLAAFFGAADADPKDASALTK